MARNILKPLFEELLTLGLTAVCCGVELTAYLLKNSEVARITRHCGEVEAKISLGCLAEVTGESSSSLPFSNNRQGLYFSGYCKMCLKWKFWDQSLSSIFIVQTRQLNAFHDTMFVCFQVSGLEDFDKIRPPAYRVALKLESLQNICRSGFSSFLFYISCLARWRLLLNFKSLVPLRNAIVIVLPVDVVSARHIEAAFDLGGRAKRGRDSVLSKEQVTQRLNEMFRSASPEFADRSTVEPTEKLCSLIFRMFDRWNLIERWMTGVPAIKLNF